MKAKKAALAMHLEHIPNIGQAAANDLRNIGITKPAHLRGKDGITLYRNLNKVTGVEHDPCVADTFMAAVDFMNGGIPKPWWQFTEIRKRLMVNS